MFPSFLLSLDLGSLAKIFLPYLIISKTLQPRGVETVYQMVDLVFKSTDIQNQKSKFTDEAFSVMTKRFPNEPKEDLARFLIARNGSVDKAAPFFQKCLDWRRENLPLKTSSFYKEYIKGKIYMHGEDKSGHPLIGESPHPSCCYCI